MPTYSYYMADLSRDRTASHGIITYSLGLLTGLAEALDSDEKLVVFGTAAMKSELEQLLPSLARIRWHETKPPDSTASRLVADHLKSTRWAADAGADLIHFPKGFIPLRKRGRAKVVATIHDDIPIRYAEGDFGEEASSLRYRYFAWQLKHSLRKADAIIAVSQFTKKCLQATAGSRPGVISVGYEAALPIASARDHIWPKKRRLLILGSTHPHKDTRTTVEYASRYLEEVEDGLELLVLGNVSEDVAQLINAAPGAGRQEGFLGNEALLTLLAESTALLFGSTYEGFGLPPLEAALAGTPVVYRRVPAVEEVMGGTHFPFDSSYASFKTALDSAVNADPIQIEKDAASLATRFSWTDVARRTLATYREVL